MNEMLYENEAMENKNEKMTEQNAEYTESQEALGYRMPEKKDEFGRPIPPWKQTWTGPIYYHSNERLGESDEIVEEKVNENPGEKVEELKESPSYSSEHYKSEMQQAIKDSNIMVYERAKRNYAKAVANETLGEAEVAAEGEEALGYSSNHFKHEYESAVANGNSIAAENALKIYAKAVANETLGESD